MTRFDIRAVTVVLVLAIAGAPVPAFSAAIEFQNDMSENVLNDLQPLDSGALQTYAGGSKNVFKNTSIANATSISSGNSIHGDIGYTGGVSGNDLTGNSGLTTVIANTGNQVSISQSTIVNVFLQ